MDNSKRQGVLRLILYFAAAALCALAVCYSGAVPTQSTIAGLTGANASRAFSALAYIYFAFDEAGLMGCAVFAAALILFRFAYGGARVGAGVPIAVLALVFAVNMLTGLSMNAYGDLRLMLGSAAQIPVALVVLLGYALLFHAALTLAYSRVLRALDMPERETGDGIGGRIWLTLAVILVCWLPYIAAYYPGSVSYDATNQLNMFFGVETWYNNHPVFSTVLIGSCVAVGRWLGSDNVGLYIYVLLQTLALAFACAYSLRCMARWRAPVWSRWLALAFFALVPVWPFFAQWVVKDTMYIAFALIFACRAMELCLYPEKAERVGPVLGLAALGLLCSLLRKNGILLALPTLIALFFALRGKRRRLGMLAALAAVAALFSLWSWVMVPAMGIGGESKADPLSVPLQQTARFVRDYGDEVMPSERDAIEAVLKDGGYDALAETYDPSLSDGVKNLFSNDTTPAELRAYLRAWLAMSLRHPLCALEATVANTYAYICPDADRSTLLFFGNWIEADPNVATGYFDFTYPDSTAGERAALYYLDHLAMNLPPSWLAYSQGSFAWLLLALCFLVCVRRRPALLAGMTPAIATFLMCLMSSVNGEYRYFMPVIAASPMMLAGVMHGLRNRKEKKT